MAIEARQNWTPWKRVIPFTPLPGDREAKGVKREAQWKSQDSDLTLIVQGVYMNTIPVHMELTWSKATAESSNTDGHMKQWPALPPELIILLEAF